MNCISKSMSDTIRKLAPAMLRFTLRGRGLSEQELDSAEEEARAALKMLQALHRKHGLEAPDQMRGMDGQEFNKKLEAAQPSEERQPEPVPGL